MEIKFFKEHKRKIIILSLILVAILGFGATYLITYNMTHSKHNANFSNKTNYETISKNDTRELIVVSENVDGGYTEKNRIKLEIQDFNKVFSDIYPIGKYEIIDFNDSSIILREMDDNNFDPNMYYIGEKDGYVTVFKTDDQGNLFVENESLDVSSKKVESLPVSDRNLVMNYELKSQNREEVQDILSELET